MAYHFSLEITNVHSRFLLPVALVATSYLFGWLAAFSRMDHAFAQDNQQRALTNFEPSATPNLAFAALAAQNQKVSATPQRDGRKPNILVIMRDDIGWFNPSCYNHGMMGYKTPNIDRIAKEGVMFTDAYGQQSCTAGRAAFITGQCPKRTGLLKIGMPGDPIGLQKEVRPSLNCSSLLVMRLVSSARTTWVTSTNSCRQITASTSSLATSIT